MPWSQSDIETLKMAIATGTSRVRFADGREVFYRSLADMRSTLEQITREVLGPSASRPLRIVAGYRSNLSS
ncbi:hypothetical protein LKMONMHP_2819 [Methylobacterium organophilum]|uniref:Uncharacterized protein n=1 Tax=Methylobacterium organophilum TaxID=410 RepID=A0ABQ4T8D5_METOR|nr:hypothetical protein LKMONMHP_2819 [Methylobacterium organophilum]